MAQHLLANYQPEEARREAKEDRSTHTKIEEPKDGDSQKQCNLSANITRKETEEKMENRQKNRAKSLQKQLP